VVIAEDFCCEIGGRLRHNVVYASVSYPAGHWADRHDKRSLLAVGYVLGAMAALMLAWGGTSLGLLVCGIHPPGFLRRS
jgi:MFS family permease